MRFPIGRIFAELQPTSDPTTNACLARQEGTEDVQGEQNYPRSRVSTRAAGSRVLISHDVLLLALALMLLKAAALKTRRLRLVVRRRTQE